MVASGRGARQRLYDVMVVDAPVEAKLERALALGAEYLGVQNAHLARIEPAADFWETVASTDPPDGRFPADQRLDLGRTFCRHVVEEGASLRIHDAVSQGWADDVAAEAHGIQCYHGRPIVLDGELYGTVSFVSESARAEPFDEADTTFAELVARTIEHELQQERLARKTERLEEFASVLSHDLRNPLNVAQLRLEMLSADDENVAIIGRSLERMEDIITNVRTMTRQARDVEETERVTLSAAAEAHWDAIRAPDADLVLEGDLVFVADRDRLDHLFENLFRNAVEHGTGSITVRVGPLPETPGFYVEDDGPGVPAADRDDVFEAGYSTGDDGHGLGLAIVESVVEAHDWQIDVTDGTDGGARFEISGVVTPPPDRRG